MENSEVCRGDTLCCNKSKPLSEFSPSALKCICRECYKDITKRNRQEKIDADENYYIYEKIRSSIVRPGIFSAILKCSDKFFYAWIKSQSKDTFNEHLDHVLPVHFFSKFNSASQFFCVRDSWINIMPLNSKDNLKKGTKVDFDLFQIQLDKANQFILNYSFETLNEKQDMLRNCELIEYHFLRLFKIYKWPELE